MPHGHTDSTKSITQNATTEETALNDDGREQNAAARLEPRTYAAAKVGNATLAATAAGEVGDDAELNDDDALEGGAQQGRSNNDRELHAQHQSQGPKTRAAHAVAERSGSPNRREA